jgi:hypothetical protein
MFLVVNPQRKENKGKLSKTDALDSKTLSIKIRCIRGVYSLTEA